MKTIVSDPIETLQQKRSPPQPQGSNKEFSIFACDLAHSVLAIPLNPSSEGLNAN
jgi:hypothetical protein